MIQLMYLLFKNKKGYLFVHCFVLLDMYLLSKEVSTGLQDL